jgi:DNA polymerase bacteriophage-type
VTDLWAGQVIPCGPFFATVLPDMDFETRSDAGFEFDGKSWHRILGANKKGLAVGVRRYIEHPTFMPLCLAYNLKDGRGPFQWKWGESFDVLEPLFIHIREGKLIEAHNAGFEYAVYQYWAVPRLGWPRIDPKQMRCSAAKSRKNGYPGALADVGAVQNITHAKDPEGKRLIKKFCEPHKPRIKDPRTHIQPWEDPIDGPKFYAYNLRDIEAESEVSLNSPDLDAFELQVWLMDQRINDRGMQVDLKGIDDTIAIYEQAVAKYGAECRHLTGGIEPSELEQLRGWLSAQGCPMMGMTDEDVEAMLARLNAYATDNGGELHEYKTAYRVLKIRQMIGSASVKKLYAMRANATAAGHLHDLYMYHAAAPGLWTGNGPQPQNLIRGEWKDINQIEDAFRIFGFRTLEAVEFQYGDAIQAINNCMRSMIIARPGYVLISSDYSAIQAVVLAQLAGEEWRLEVFRTHGMIYEASVSKATGTPFEEFLEYKAQGKKHPLRQLGKLFELSGGFAAWIGGWKRFGADEFFANDFELKKAILAWRAASPMIVEFWGGQSRGGFGNGPARPELYGLEGAAIAAVKDPGMCYRYRDIGFQMWGDDLYMQLPSGRLITYHDVALRPATRDWAQPWELALSYWGFNTNQNKGVYGWSQMDLYGGVLTQNAVAGTARDIMAHGMLNLEEREYPIVCHTHDEIVSEIFKPEFETGMKTIEGFERCMNDLPDWAKGWPIFARGGWAHPRYGKYD